MLNLTYIKFSLFSHFIQKAQKMYPGRVHVYRWANGSFFAIEFCPFPKRQLKGTLLLHSKVPFHIFILN